MQPPGKPPLTNNNHPNDQSRWLSNPAMNQQPPQNIQQIPNHIINQSPIQQENQKPSGLAWQGTAGSTNHLMQINQINGTNHSKKIKFVNESLTPYNLSNLSKDEISNLKKHNLGYTLIPLTVIFGVLGILFSWFFGISVYLWSTWISLRHQSILSKLPQSDHERRMNSILASICWIPLLNLLIIPYIQDKTRRKLNLQFSLRNEMLPFSRKQITTTSWLMSISLLFFLPFYVAMLSFESLYDWEVSVVSLFWHIPIITISITTLIYLVSSTNDSKLGWWPNKTNESKTSRDLIEATSIPLLITIITVFTMLIIILPIYGSYGLDRTYYSYANSKVYEMQMWVFFPCMLTLFFGLMFKQDFTKQQIVSNRRGEYLLYVVILASFAIVPMIFVVLIWFSMALMLAALIMILYSEITISLAINNICFSDKVDKSWGSKKPQPTTLSIPGNVFYNPQNNHAQQYIQQQFQQQIQANPMSELTNTRNRFTKTQMFASGGMAKVFHCIDNSNGELMVWKQAQGTHIPLNDANKRLKYEAEVLMAANHPRIPTYFGFTDIKNEEGQDANVLIMEFLEGGDLKSTVTQIAKVGLIMPAETIINYLKEMCEPLIHMSSFKEPIYHRDLKPHNIIIHPTRGPVIIDWGLAKAVHGGSDISVTRGGSGTWTSPERDSGISGPFTDVYSLGKILYYLATCKQPPAIVSNAERDEMVELGHPEWLAELMLKAAWPRHQERIQGVEEFSQLLDNKGETKSTESLIDIDDVTTWGQ